MLSDAKKDALGLINWGEFRLNFSNYEDRRSTMKLSERIADIFDGFENITGREIDRASVAKVRKLEAVVEAGQELQEVADLRGDNILPHPEDDPGLWTARMQTAWDELREALVALEVE